MKLTAWPDCDDDGDNNGSVIIGTEDGVPLLVTCRDVGIGRRISPLPQLDGDGVLYELTDAKGRRFTCLMKAAEG
jgi:hypothetical protein